MGFVLIGAYFSREVLMPRINRQRDAMVQGNDDAEIPFNRLHRSSVLINTLQIIAVFCVLVRLLT